MSRQGKPFTWTESVLEAIRRTIKSQGVSEFTLQDLIDRELNTIKNDTGTTGKTPQKTLSLTVQKMIVAKIVQQIGRGKYCLVDEYLID